MNPKNETEIVAILKTDARNGEHLELVEDRWNDGHYCVVLVGSPGRHAVLGKSMKDAVDHFMNNIKAVLWWLVEKQDSPEYRRALDHYIMIIDLSDQLHLISNHANSAVSGRLQTPTHDNPQDLMPAEHTSSEVAEKIAMLAKMAEKHGLPLINLPASEVEPGDFLGQPRIVI